MLLPLWGRAIASAKNPQILDDREAIRIIENSRYDFSAIAKTFGEFGGICYIVRSRKCDDQVKHFIKKHPKATIVNIGAGLDTTFSRVDNGQIRWYNLDLPDAVAFRRSLLPDSPRNSSIAKSFFDHSWFDDIVFREEDGIFFMAGGVFYYFRKEELLATFAAMAERFPGGELYFDAESKMALNQSNRMVKKTGNQGAAMYFYINGPQDLADWPASLQVLEIQPYFNNIDVNPGWSRRIRLKIKLSDKIGVMKFIHLRFIPTVQ